MENLSAIRTRVHLKFLGFAVAAVAMLALTGQAVAQRPPAPMKKFAYDGNLKNDRFAVEDLLKSEAPIPANDEQKFDNYFQNFILPEIAMPSRNLPLVRAKIRRHFRIARGPAYARLNALVRDYMKFVIKNSKSQACQINATIVLGDLNESEGSVSTPPTPLPAALDDLIVLLKDPAVPDYIKTTAMVGVQRHVDVKIADTHKIRPEAKAEITKLMLALLNERQVPPTRTPSGHAYLRRSAAEILGEIGDIGKNGEIVNAVLNAMQEPNAPIYFRLGLSSVIGNFKYEGKLPVQPKQVAAAICYAAIDATEKELARVEELTTQLNEVVDPDKRRIGYIFKQANLGLAGTNPRYGRTGIVVAAGSSPDASTLQDLKSKVAKILNDVDKAPYIASEDLESKLASIQEVLPKRPATDKLSTDVAGAKQRKAAAKGPVPGN